MSFQLPKTCLNPELCGTEDRDFCSNCLDNLAQGFLPSYMNKDTILEIAHVNKLDLTEEEVKALLNFFDAIGFIHPRRHDDVHKIINRMNDFMGNLEPNYDMTRRGRL